MERAAAQTMLSVAERSKRLDVPPPTLHTKLEKEGGGGGNNLVTIAWSPELSMGSPTMYQPDFM